MRSEVETELRELRDFARKQADQLRANLIQPEAHQAIIEFLRSIARNPDCYRYPDVAMAKMLLTAGGIKEKL